jgi:hypothetical protein
MKLSAQSRRRGIALVITLIMLSVVTITAVAFLAVSRRERNAVASTSDQIDARNIADAGLARARAEVAARLVAAQDIHALSFLVSTNFINPYLKPGFLSYADRTDFNQLTNVNYYKDPANQISYDLGRTADLANYERMLANLFYDPRPPVFVETNRSRFARPDFRFYLDLNRNGRYESNGWVWPTDRNGRTNGFAPQFMVGDPEWIGVLQHPDAPHSGTNPFVGRYAYVIVPDSQTLDLNSAFNATKANHGVSDAPGSSAFFRNQGVGAWELNLAAFLSDLNTNIWGPRYVPLYAFQTNITRGSSGLSFDDAGRILRYRLPQSPRRLAAVNAFFYRQSGVADPSLSIRMGNDGVDLYSDGPVVQTPAEIIRGAGPDNDNPGSPWPGADATNYFTDINELYSSTLGLAPKLTGVWPTNGTTRTSSLSTYDNYTYYRLLGQLGVDGADGRFETGVHPAYSAPGNPYGFYRRAKLNLNYAMDYPNGGDPTNAEVVSRVGVRDWSPVGWMTNAANRLLLSEFPAGLPMQVTDGQGNVVRVNPGIPLFGFERVRGRGLNYITNHTYTAEIHRQLQLAANIFDYTSNRLVRGIGYPYPPTIYRPVIYHNASSPATFRLAGFTEVTSTNDINARWWLPNDPVLVRQTPVYNSSTDLPSGNQAQALNVFGIPWVVGAKKGLPSFNEGFWQTALQVTRRLIFTKPTTRSFLSGAETPFAGANGEGFRTFAQYLINLTNTIGVEAWNSYSNAYPRPVTVFATNYHQFALRTGDPTNGPVLISTNYPVPAGVVRVAANQWKGNQFVSPLNTNIVYNFIYDPTSGRIFSPFFSNNVASTVSTLLPSISIAVTNSMVFTIVDDLTGRFLDVVTLQSRIFETNLFSNLGPTNNTPVIRVPGVGTPGSGGLGTQLDMPNFWYPTAAGAYGTLGIENQFLVSVGARQPQAGLWVDALGGPAPSQDRTNSIDGLNYFLYGRFPPGVAPNSATADRIRRSFGNITVVQAGFNPSPTIFLTDRRMANDPLVHYTMDDLRPGYALAAPSSHTGHYVAADGTIVPLRGAGGTGAQLDPRSFTNQIGLRFPKPVQAYAPWGREPNDGLNAQVGNQRPGAGGAIPGNATGYDMMFKDPQIISSDAWRFPTNSPAERNGTPDRKYANIGELGQVHRGTPWQTVYWKSGIPAVGQASDSLNALKSWYGWNHSPWNHPTNDWKLADLFTTALNDNAARGLMGAGQTNLAAWSALLGGVAVFDNRSNPRTTPQLRYLEPGSPEVVGIVAGYTNKAGVIVPGVVQTMTNQIFAPGGHPPGLASVFATPALTQPPFLDIPHATDVANWQSHTNLTDELIERIPQQVLSLMRSDEPRVTIYSFGQTLKPALNSLVTKPGPFYGMATNYQITGDYATKTVIRFDGYTNNLAPVVEEHRVLFPVD